MSQKKNIPTRKSTKDSLIDNEDIDSDSDIEERRQNSYLRKISAQGKTASNVQYSPLTGDKMNNPEWQANRPNFQNFMQTEGFRRFLVALFLLIAVIAVAFLITVLIQNSDVVDRMTNRASKIGTCHGEINPFDQNEKIYVGRVQGNQTSIVSVDSFSQQFRINHVDLPTVRGRPVWLTRQNEVWIPNTDLDTIEIYESTTMNLKTIISTQNSGNLVPCFSPQFTGYHPYAGQFYRGQVWVSCIGSPQGWAVFDPFTRSYEAFVPLPLTFGPYMPYDIAVGQAVTVVSLLNTSVTTNANLIQYSNINFLPTILSQVVGHSPLLAYAGQTDSFLFVSSFYANAAYKLSFQTLIVEYTWVNITEPWGIATDPVAEALLYVVESGLNNVRVFLVGSPYFEFPFSPIPTPVDRPANIRASLREDHIYVTSFVNDTLTAVYEVDPNTGTPNDPSVIVTGSGSFYLTNNAINCICELCYS